MTQPALSIVPTADDVSASAGAFIAETLAGAIRERGAAHWCTTGGSSAPGVYRALRAAPLRDRVDWSRVHTWWGDDRFVPAGDPLSNVTPFDDVLREQGAGIAISDANVHPVPVAEAMAGGGGPEGAAAAYEAELRSRGPAAGMLRPAARRDHPLLGVPAFDLVILGVGPDGHILSVFPGSFVFDQPGWVAAVPAPTHVEPHVPRVTIHPSLVMAARSVLVVTAGASKAEILAQAWAGGDPRELPLRTTLSANATWLVDEAAARLLKT